MSVHALGGAPAAFNPKEFVALFGAARQEGEIIRPPAIYAGQRIYSSCRLGNDYNAFSPYPQKQIRGAWLGQLLSKIKKAGTGCVALDRSLP